MMYITPVVSLSCESLLRCIGFGGHVPPPFCALRARRTLHPLHPFWALHYALQTYNTW